jgi:RND family efflux transporter MFP subunit
MRNGLKAGLLVGAVFFAGILLGTEGLQRAAQPSQSIHVSARAERRVTEVLVQEGDHVLRGQVIMRLDSEEERIHCLIAEAKVELAEAQLQAADERLSRRKEMFDKGIIPEAQYRDMLHERNCVQARFHLAQRELELAELKARAFDLTAPVDGVVEAQPLHEGQVACKDLQILIARDPSSQVSHTAEGETLSPAP